MTSKLIWVDLESTGSREYVDPILEVGAVLTEEDAPWTEIESYSAVCKPGDPDWENLMGDYVREMHTKNGLLDDVRSTSKTIFEIEDDLIAILSRHGKPGDFVLAGSGVGHFDRRMVRVQMPRLEAWLRYPNFDIGDVRRILKFSGRGDLVRSGITQAVQGDENKAHRGLDDIRDHIAEAVEYSKMMRSTQPVGSGSDRISRERSRQWAVKGWSSDHDAHHTGGDLIAAAVCYAMQADPEGAGESAVDSWPWDESYWRPSEDPVRNLEKAGALIAAEIDRILATRA